MNVIYDATIDYLQAMILTPGVDVWQFTEFDKLFCLMVFFQVSFYRDPVQFKCQHCGVDINYRYDMSTYLSKMDKDTYVENQTVAIPYKSKVYEFTIGWPTVREMSRLYEYFYSQNFMGIDVEKKTLYELFCKKSVELIRSDRDDQSLSRIENLLEEVLYLVEYPTALCGKFEEKYLDKEGLFAKITGYFINRLENCFGSETCPQCHRDTNYGLQQSQLFYGLFYGSLRSIYGFIIQVECLLLFRYDCLIFDKEQHMTYNDLQTLMKQLSTTVEKDNRERQKGSRDHLYKGLWLIREILNTMVFPQDKKH